MDSSLSVVIGTRNRLDILKKCLHAIVGKIKAYHEIIIVDAGSNDGTIEYLNNIKEIKLICDGKPLGQARSLNRVFRTLRTKYSCWLSDDNIIKDGVLDRAISILEENKDIGMIALKVKDVKGSFTSALYIGGIQDTGILTCNQGVIRNDLLKSIGFFDESFQNYGIDADLTAKVLLSGAKIAYTKEIAIEHYRDYESESSAISKNERFQRMKSKNKVYNNKYVDLLKPTFTQKLSSRSKEFIWVYIKKHDRKLRKKQLMFGLWLGHNIRDWFNLTHCRYISIFDFWKNRRNAYYLVQQMRRHKFYKRQFINSDLFKAN